VIANLKKDVETIQDVQVILNNLAEGWKQIHRPKAGLRSTTPVQQQIRITG
jgi:flagellin-specific chaperone FliS